MVNQVVEFPDQNVIELEAAQWLVALDREEPPSAELLAELTEWMARSHAHRKTLTTLNQFMSDTSLTDLMVPLDQHVAQEKTSSNSHWFEKLFNWPVMGGAFASFIGVLVMVLMFGQVPGEIDNSLLNSNGLYISAQGQQKNYTLADGSVVTLSANSKIKVDFKDSARDIQLLRGKAHFEVAHNKQVPFRVYGAQGRVEAVGTAFTVQLKEKLIDVLVTEGTVALASSGKAKIMNTIAGIQENLVELGHVTAGERVVVDTVATIDEAMDAVNMALKLDAHTLNKMQAWREGMLVFTGESLETVIDVITSATGYKITIVDEDVKSIKVAGSFKVDNISSILDSLESNFPVKISVIGHQEVEIAAAD